MPDAPTGSLPNLPPSQIPGMSDYDWYMATQYPQDASRIGTQLNQETQGAGDIWANTGQLPPNSFIGQDSSGGAQLRTTSSGDPSPQQLGIPSQDVAQRTQDLVDFRNQQADTQGVAQPPTTDLGNMMPMQRRQFANEANPNVTGLGFANRTEFDNAVNALRAVTDTSRQPVSPAALPSLGLGNIDPKFLPFLTYQARFTPRPGSNNIWGIPRVEMAQGGLVNMPGYYATGGLGIPQMNSAASQAHYGALNAQRATHIPGAKLPAIHARAPSFNPRSISTRPPGGAMRMPGVHLIHSPVPGRVDRIPMHVRTNSYILPADVVSGLGQGNTYAGAKMWGQAISHAAGPYGTTNTMRTGRLNAPRLNMRVGKTFARGGAAHDYTPVITAGGECLIDPEIVAALGGGDMDKGKKCLADSVKKVRGQVVAQMKKLPGPVN